MKLAEKAQPWKRDAAVVAELRKSPWLFRTICACEQVIPPKRPNIFTTYREKRIQKRLERQSPDDLYKEYLSDASLDRAFVIKVMLLQLAARGDEQAKKHMFPSLNTDDRLVGFKKALISRRGNEPLNTICNGSYDDACQAIFDFYALKDGRFESIREQIMLWLGKAITARNKVHGAKSREDDLLKLAACLAGYPGFFKGNLFREYTDASMFEFSQQIAKNKDGIHGANAFYYAQALRNGICWFIQTNGGLVPVTHTGTHPLQFIIMGPIKGGSEEAIAKAANELRELSGNEVIVKYLTGEQAGNLTGFGFKVGQKCREDRIEADMNHPEVVINIEERLGADGKAILDSRLRIKVNGFLNWARREGVTLENRQLGQGEKIEPVLELLTNWANLKKERSGKAGVEIDLAYLIESHLDIMAFYPALLDYAKSHSAIFLANGVPIGAYVMSPISGDSLGLYASPCDTAIPGASEYVIYEAMKEARKNGYKFINLGGSESESLYGFKRKFGSFEVPYDYAVLPLEAKEAHG